MFDSALFQVENDITFIEEGNIEGNIMSKLLSLIIASFSLNAVANGDFAPSNCDELNEQNLYQVQAKVIGTEPMTCDSDMGICINEGTKVALQFTLSGCFDSLDSVDLVHRISDDSITFDLHALAYKNPKSKDTICIYPKTVVKEVSIPHAFFNSEDVRIINTQACEINAQPI